jgi:hypothetical protein
VSDRPFLAGAAWLCVAVPVLLYSVCIVLSHRALLLVKWARLLLRAKRARLLRVSMRRVLAGGN